MSDFACLVLRWVARATGIIVVGVFLLLAFGEMVFTHTGVPTRLAEWCTFVLFTAGMAGIVLAWKWELPGALLSLACLALFGRLVQLKTYGPVVIAAVPALLFVADWLVRHATHPHPARS